jgi:hypothetical protein
MPSEYKGSTLPIEGGDRTIDRLKPNSSIEKAGFILAEEEHR